MNNLVFVADAHINNDPREVQCFSRFLNSIQPSTQVLCILGDLFNLWIAKKRLEHPYHGEVLDHLRKLKMLGLKLVYVEGNRDFHVKRAYYGDPFDDVSGEERVEVFDGRKFYMHHGDKINVDDYAYRLWKKFSKSNMTWTFFNALPIKARSIVSGHLERMLRKTNIKHKSYFPQKRCEEFGEKILSQDIHAMIIGHLHQENILEFDLQGQKKLFYSLPSWKLQKRYLLFEPGKEGRFISYSD